MCSKRGLCLTAGCSASTMILMASLFSVAGCNPHKDQLRPENLFGRLGRQNGQVLEPKKCMLRVAILNRSLRDSAINDVVWKVADEQVVPPETRRALEVNGLRVGRITGEFPPELEAVMNAPPPNKVEPATFLLDDSEQTLISLGEPIDQVTLLLNRENRAYGKDYHAASGYFRVTPQQDGGSSVSLRFSPEIHHGQVQRTFQPLSSTTAYTPQQFKINDGQEEETLGDLAAVLALEPGQVAVIGCRPEQDRSLGCFLLTQGEPHGDLRHQKLILVWASRNQLGVLGDKPESSDRPILSLRGKDKSKGRISAGGNAPAVPAMKPEAKDEPKTRR